MLTELMDAQVATLLDQCLASHGSAVEHAVAVLVELAKVACKQLKDSNAGFVTRSLSLSLARSLSLSLARSLSRSLALSRSLSLSPCVLFLFPQAAAAYNGG